MKRKSNGYGPVALAIGATLREIRQAQGLTLQDVEALCSEAGYPLSFNAISKSERGVRTLAPDDLVALASGLGVQVADLFGETAVAPVAEFKWRKEAARLLEQLESTAEFVRSTLEVDR